MVAVIVSWAALVASILAAWVAFKVSDDVARSPDLVRQASDEAVTGLRERVETVERVVSDTLHEVEKRLDVQETRGRNLQQEWEAWWAKARAIEGRIDRKRGQLAASEPNEDLSGEEDGPPPWEAAESILERNGEEPPAPVDVETALFRLRHGRR